MNYFEELLWEHRGKGCGAKHSASSRKETGGMTSLLSQLLFFTSLYFHVKENSNCRILIFLWNFVENHLDN